MTGMKYILLRAWHKLVPSVAPLPLAAALSICAGAIEANAQNVQHLSVTVPGGMPGTSTLTSVQTSTNGVFLTWDGPAGYYGVLYRTNPAAKWKSLGLRTNLLRKATVPAKYTNAYFSVSGPAPIYAGAAICRECHSSIYTNETHTRHAAAFTNAAFAASGGQTNASCLPCHTVGYGLPTGFKALAKTPKLAGVQCENCHGPAGRHAANPDDSTVRPRAELASTVCGGCHSGSMNPTFEEWASSDHAQVTEEITGLLASTNYLNYCGRCHSGSARNSLVNKKARLPVGDALVGVVCTTCHDPHKNNGNPAQLRYPVASTNDFTLGTTNNFASSFNPNINVCGQCHNSRGASWTNNSLPHLSLQYNMLLGTVGDIASKQPHYQPASHATMITNQCVGCHMETAAAVDESHPGMTGHSFKIQKYQICGNCHSDGQGLAEFAKEAVTNQMMQVVAALNYWATTASPDILRTNYQERAWEYPAAGPWSVPGPSPAKDQQTLIPENIRRARFNLYLVNSDGGAAIHNGPYAVELLETALDFIVEELNQ